MDFSPDATPRYIVEYVSAGITHHVMFRPERDTTYTTGVAAGALAIHDWLVEIVTSLPTDFAFTSAVFINQDTDFALPADVPAPVTGLQNLANYSAEDKIRTLTFPGRGFGGSRVSYTVFGVQFNPDVVPAGVSSDYVFNAGEAPTIDAAVDALNSAALLRCIDNTKPIFRKRVTLKTNDHFLKFVRRGIISGN